MHQGLDVVRQFAWSVLLPVILCLGSVWSPNGANATEYYVGTTGNDANPGGPSQPFQTIQKGMSVLQPGDTLYLRQGTYTEKIDPNYMTLPSGTSWSNAITIAGYPGEKATIRNGINIQDNGNSSIPAYLIFDNFIVRNSDANAFRVGGNAHHIRLSNSDVQSGRTNTISIAYTTSDVQVINCDIHDSPVEFVPEWGVSTGTYGLYINGNNMLIDGNRIYNNTGYGIHLYGGINAASNNIVRNNSIYNNCLNDGTRSQAAGGVIITSGSNNSFYNNLVYNHTGSFCGPAVSLGYADNSAYNNTIYGNKGFGLELGASTTGMIVRNNILYGNGRNSVVDWGSINPVIDHNLIDVNPQFVNAAANDFSLQAGSPAIDAGVAISLVTTDIKGVSRPQGAAYDVGTYEYSKESTPLPTPSHLRLITVSP